MRMTEALPIPETRQKYQEAEYFLVRCAEHYHFPLEFQFNLNAFIQALRNVTFMLQSESQKPEGFGAWYASKREDMKSNEVLRRFVEARNVVVKQSSLTAKSKAWSGLYRGRRMKLAFQHELPLLADTPWVLEKARNFAVGFFLDEAHSAIGEQVGVERTWIVEQLGSSEVLGNCLSALNYMGALIAEAQRLYGVDSKHEEVELNMPRIQILLETDLDPTLASKWGWE
jgi:hypothetical protein